MPKTKYNRELLKRDFLLSEFDDVTSFLDHIWITKKINRKYVKWWVKAKKDYMHSVTNRVLDIQIEKDAETFSIPISLLLKCKRNCFVRIWQLVNETNSIPEAVSWLKLIKTELGEPLSVKPKATEEAKNFNVIRINDAENDPERT